MIVEVDVKTAGATQGRAQVASAFSGIEQDAQRASANASSAIGNIDSSLSKNATTLGVWGRAFRGAFIGAVAGIAFSAVIGGMSSIVEKGEELIVQSVKYAAAFQMRENSMAVYTGSLNNASSELNRLDQLALHTTGLRLDDAETGSLRLRALGIDAKTVDDVLVGLAKQKLIFGGVNEQQVQRVLLHFDQLAGGASNTGQIIKNMIRDMPGLSAVMVNTFGSINKFKAALQADPDTALQKFAKGMADAKAPAGGLTNAIEKMEDRLILAGRTFGQPFLDPLTKDVNELSDYLDKNGDSWAMWGQSVADAVQGAILALKELREWLPTAISPAIGAAPDVGGHSILNPGGIVTGSLLNIATAGISGGYESFSNLGAIERRNAYLARKANEAPAGLGTRASISFGTDADIAAQKKADADRVAQKVAKDQEKAQADALASSKEYQARDRAILEDSLSIKLKSLDNYHRYTLQDELAYDKRVGAMTQANIAQEIDLEQKNFKRRYDLTGDDKKARELLAIEESTTMSKLRRQQAEAVIDAAIKEREDEVRIAEEKRQALVQAAQLQIRSIQQVQSASEFNLNRQINLTQTGYESLIDATIAANGKVVAETKHSFDLQLQDQKLSKEQRINLEREMQLQIQDLNEQTRQKVVAIQDQQSKAIEDRIKHTTETANTLMGVFTSNLTNVQQLFQATPFFGDLFKTTTAIMPAIGVKNQGDLSSMVIDVEQGKKSMYDAQLLVLQKIQATQIETINQEISGQEDLQKQLQVSGSTYELGLVRSQITILNAQKEGLILSQAIERSNLEQTTSLAKIDEWTQRILAGERDRVIHSIQEVSIHSQYQSAALAFQTQEVTMGDKSLVSMMRQTEMLKTITELRGQDLQAVLAIDKAQLLINQQYQYSGLRANAQVANFLSQQKGLTEVIGDARINLLTTAYDGLATVADKLTRKFGAFRDVIKDLLANLFRLAFNKIFGNIISGGSLNFGGGSSNQGGGFGGFKLPSLSFGGGSSGGGFGFGGSSGGGYLAGGFAGSAAPSVFTSPSGFENIFGGGAAGGAALGSGAGLLGPGAVKPSTIGGAIGSSGTAAGGFLAGLAPMLPFLGAGIGAGAFGSSRGSSILGGVGGALAGVAGFGLLGGFGSLAASGTISTSLALSLTAAIPIFGAAAAAVLVGAYFLNRSAARRRDEKTRNAAMVTAFDALDKLIADVNADRTDGASALSQADQIRKQYLDQMGQLKDKKTRNIALADVSRIDAKIATLKSAVGNQVARKQREELMVPTFADGGSVSAFMSPVGYQFGYGGPRSDNMTGYFPAAGSIAHYSPSEYILDAETTRNVGVGNLDTMRATKGVSFQQMRRDMPVRRASGGSVASMPFLGSSSASGGTSGPVTLEVTLQIGISEEQFVKISEATVKNANGSKQQLSAILKTIKNDGNHPLVTEIGKQLDKQNS